MIEAAIVGCFVIACGIGALGIAYGIGYLMGRHGLVVAVTDTTGEF
ncbi:MAG: hypothetical protein KGL35_19160 [Bradyrhizobium sp.]|nr:hypothetical protein [Bradyrhizobium sp.]